MNRYFLLIFLFLFTTSCTLKNTEIEKPVAINGIINLKNAINKNGILKLVNLDGTWEFYWGQHLSSVDLVNSIGPKPSFVEVPGNWNNTYYDGELISSTGYATYRLKILQPEYSKPMAIAINQIGTNYRLYINGNLKGGMGISGLNRETSRPEIIPMIYRFQTNKKEIEIIIQVSNFHYWKGGIWRSIKFGDAELLEKSDLSYIFYEAFLISCLLIIGVYYIIINIINKRNYSPLFFGLACITMSARQMVMDHKIIVKLIPSIPWELYLKIEFLSLGFVIPLFALYLYNIIRGYFSKKYIYVLTIISLLFSTIVIFTDSQFFSRTILLYEINIIIFIFYCLYILTRAANKKNPEAKYLLWSGSILFIAIINDILNANEIIFTMYLTPFGAFLFMMSQAVILAKWYLHSFDTSEKLFDELSVKNENLILANNELIQLKENLDEKIQERTKNLETNHKIAEEASMAKSLFLANMSHEIRTPLNNVHGYIELMERTPLNDEQYKYLHIINKSAKNLLGIINDILDFSKIESGKLEINNSIFNPEIEFQSIIELFYLKAIEKKITLLSYIEPDLPIKIIGDSLRIKQVLTNLLSNAIKFTHDDGFVIVEILKNNENDSYININFSVTDTGIGIPEYKQEKMFESFEQETSSITGKYGGSGLGLSISSNLVDLMDGKLKIESEKGKGSKFYFDIKLAKPDSGDEYLIKKNFNRTINIATFTDNPGSIKQREFLDKYLMAMDFSLNVIKNFDELKNIKNIDILFYINSENLNYSIYEHFKDNNELKIVAVLNDAKIIKLKKINKRVNCIINQPIDTTKIVECIAEILVNSPYEKEINIFENEYEDVQYNASILVAEDNLSTQDLMKILLEGSGLKVDIANNGLEAIEKIKENNYDLIFLDINMPVYDGTEVAEISIEYENKKNIKHTPLVALTALAIKGDSDRILSSGFDEYLSKPLHFKKLKEILEKYLDHLKFNKITGNNNSEASLIHENNEIYNVDNAASKMGVTADMLKNLLEKAFPRFYKDLDILKKAINKNDYGNIYQSSHKLKGSFYNFIFNEIGDIANEIETNSEKKNMIDYFILFNKIKIKLDELKDQLL